MGSCTSAEKIQQKNQIQTQSKTISQVNSPTNPFSAIKQEPRSSRKVQEIHTQGPNLVPAYIQTSKSHQIQLSQKKDEKKDENLSGSWKSKSFKINEDIPENLVVKAFYHTLQPPKDMIRNSLPRKSHHEGVDPIIERRFNSQSDENSETAIKKMAINQEMGVEPWIKVNGFSWEKKVGEVSLLD